MRLRHLLLILPGLAVAVPAHASMQSLGSQDITFSTGATSTTLTEKMRITNGGLVGIGTGSPSSTLHVAGRITGGFGADGTAGVTDWNDSTNARSGSGKTLLLGTATNGPGFGAYFHPFTFEYPAAKDGTGQLTQFAIPYATGALPYGLFMRGRYNGTWSNWYSILSDNGSGKFGIGLSAPSYPLDVSGTVRATAFIGDGSGLTNLSGDNLGNGSATTVIKAIPGSVSAPGYAFGNDTDTGLYSVGADFLGLSTGGTSRLMIDADGNVAIGATPNAAYKFYVNAPRTDSNGSMGFISAVNQTLTTSAAITNYAGYNYAVASTGAGIANTGSLYGLLSRSWNNGAGNITTLYGIYSDTGNYTSGSGTVTNAYGITSQVRQSAGTVTNGYGLYITDVGATNGWGVYQAGANDNNYFAGNVGIGTNNPTAKLEVNGTVSATQAILTGTDTDTLSVAAYGNMGGSAVNAQSHSGYGVFGLSDTNNGIAGQGGTGGYGLYGTTASAAKGGAIGYAQNGTVYGALGYANAYALYGAGAISVTGDVNSAGRVYGHNTAGYGVYGTSTNTFGIVGSSDATYGIRGQTGTATTGGVIGYAQNLSTYGILGYNNAYSLYGNGQAYVSGNISTAGSVYATGGGAPTAPEFSFSNDTNTGMYWVSADNLGLTTGGVQRVLVNSSGLTVTGSISANTTLDAVTGNSTSGFGVHGTSGVSYGVYGLSTSGAGVFGDTPGNGQGVFGRSSGATGKAIFGWATSSTGISYGVYGMANSTTGYGVYCTATNNASGCGGDRAWTNTSDARLKRDVATLDDSEGLAAVMKLRPVTFKWRTDDSGKTDMGFIAQEVEPILPELVGSSPDASITTDAGTKKTITHVKSLSYAGFVVPLVKAVQQQQAEIEKLRADTGGYKTLDYAASIKELSAQVKQLQADNASLKAEMEKLKAAR